MSMNEREFESILQQAHSDLNTVLQSKRTTPVQRFSLGDMVVKQAIVETVDEDDLEYTLEDLLDVMKEHNASDLHIKEGSPPMVRIHGTLLGIGEHKLTPEDCERLILSGCTPNQQTRLRAGKTLDYAIISNETRYRVNAFRQKLTLSASIRMIRDTIPSFDDLHLPPHLSQLMNHRNGLVLVTGPAGCGKSTTLAAMIDFINEHKPLHIITMEDPIEYYHTHKKALVTQREIGSDTVSFEAALKYSLRQDPNVILIGEMRDPDTIMTAARAAETGHLVLSTLHTPNCVQAVTRMLDVFTGENRKQMRLLLANNLRGVISQRLLPRTDNEGRVPAVEIMVVTPTIASLIMDGNINDIYNFIHDGSLEGMQTMNQSLLRLYQDEIITYEDALSFSDQATELRMMMEGHSTSFGTMADHTASMSSDDDNLMSWI